MSRLPTRRAGQPRAGQSIRRSSAGLSRTRALAAFVLVLAGLAIYGVGKSPVFAFRAPVDLEGASWTKAADVTALLGISDGTNLVTLRTDDLATRLEGLPAVRSAEVRVVLPNTIRVQLDERQPILVWQTSGGRFLVDASGVAFVRLADGAAVLNGLPTIADARAAATVSVGSSIDPVAFDAARRLGSLTPADLGSAANGLVVSLGDDQGFTLKAVPNLWTAVFGFYTTSLRPPTMIPDQVRLLRSLIAGREPTIESMILADAQNGTFTTKAKP
jgi:cell division septal protein FtsQ